MLAIAVAVISVSLAGCASFTNPTGPERLTAMPSEQAGIAVISAGAAKPCIVASTLMIIAPYGAGYMRQGVGQVPVDMYTYKSDYPDHQGNITAVALPPGDYQAYPFLMNGMTTEVRTPRYRFTVRPNEITYVGEYYLEVACGLSTLGSFRDRKDRDMALAVARNPRLAGYSVRTDLAKLDGRIVDKH
jgi:hypothetical protein